MDQYEDGGQLYSDRNLQPIITSSWETFFTLAYVRLQLMILNECNFFLFSSSTDKHPAATGHSISLHDTVNKIADQGAQATPQISDAMTLESFNKDRYMEAGQVKKKTSVVKEP